MQQAALFSPYDAYYNVRLGMLYLQASFVREAAEAFRQAVALDPENASYHCLLGDAYAQLGYERLALEHYRSAGKLDPYDAAYVERVRRLTATEIF
jgi:Flp pilus assembly protein TadD